jgi:predicted transcriptional regulator
MTPRPNSRRTLTRAAIRTEIRTGNVEVVGIAKAVRRTTQTIRKHLAAMPDVERVTVCRIRKVAA